MAKQWADQLVAMGKPIEDDDLISLIISGLHLMFNSFITVVKKKKKKKKNFYYCLLICCS
jgi:hypothetical protein